MRYVWLVLLVVGVAWLCGCKDYVAATAASGQADTAAAKDAQAKAQALAGLTGTHKANADALAKSATGTPVKPVADKNAAEAGAIDTGAKGVVTATGTTVTDTAIHQSDALGLADTVAKQKGIEAAWLKAKMVGLGLIGLLTIGAVIYALLPKGIGLASPFFAKVFLGLGICLFGFAAWQWFEDYILIAAVFAGLAIGATLVVAWMTGQWSKVLSLFGKAVTAVQAGRETLRGTPQDGQFDAAVAGSPAMDIETSAAVAKVKAGALPV